MASSKQYGKSLVTQSYLNGKSMDQIVSETGVSKGKVHYLISGWKDEIGAPDIDELREFSVTVRKSGISIGQCAQGFRMISILKNLGIHEGDGAEGAMTLATSMMEITTRSSPL
jgi:predicted peroxiredoxin